jgi:hypothetical protein
MSKAVAIFDGFVGHNGKNVQIIAGSTWSSDHEVVRAHPDKFDIANNGPGESKEQRVKRLRAELAEAEAETASASQEDDDEGTPVGAEGSIDRGEELPPYTEWKLADLQAECRDRGLSANGTKADLAARLDQYDAEHPE